MKRVLLAGIAALSTMALAGCDPIAYAYADRHIETPTNTIAVPAKYTEDGQPGWAVCQHFMTSWVLYDKADVVSTNVIHAEADNLCKEEGRRIKAGEAPQDLHIQSVYRSNEPSETLGAYLNRE